MCRATENCKHTKGAPLFHPVKAMHKANSAANTSPRFPGDWPETNAKPAALLETTAFLQTLNFAGGNASLAHRTRTQAKLSGPRIWTKAGIPKGSNPQFHNISSRSVNSPPAHGLPNRESLLLDEK